MSKILIVDDDEKYCQALATLFQSEGHEVRTAFDPGQFAAETKEYIPDLVIMDIQMPGGGAPAAIKTMENNPALASVRVLFLSGMPVDKAKLWFPEGPRRRHAHKPIPLTELSALVKDFLAS